MFVGGCFTELYPYSQTATQKNCGFVDTLLTALNFAYFFSFVKNFSLRFSALILWATYSDFKRNNQVTKLYFFNERKLNGINISLGRAVHMYHSLKEDVRIKSF